MYIKTITYYYKGERLTIEQTKLKNGSFSPNELLKGYKLVELSYFNDEYGNCVYMFYRKSKNRWVRVTIEKE